MVKLLRHLKKKEGNIFFPLKVINNLICGRNIYGTQPVSPGILTLPQLILIKYYLTYVFKPVIFNQRVQLTQYFLTIFIHQ